MDFLSLVESARTPTMALVAWLLGAIGAYIGLDLAHRLASGRPWEGARWLVCAAVATATGLWAAIVAQVAAQPVPFALGYNPTDIAGTWLMTALLAGGGLMVAAGQPCTRGRIWVGSLLLGLAVISAQVGTLLALGLRPGPRWHEIELGAALAIAVFGTSIALTLVFVHRVRREAPLLRWQIGAAAVFGLVVAVCQQVLFVGADIAFQQASLWGAKLPSIAISVLAAAGSAVLLPVMLLTSNLEAQARASLRHARGVLRRHALIDLLTTLPNRQGFELELEQAVAAADRDRERLALLYVDLDGFKPLNESFGHANGDQILREIAQRLQATLPPEAVVARLGADEFLALLPGNPRREDASKRAAALMAAIASPVRIDGREASLSCSIGVAMYPEHGSASVLMLHADAAMRACKGQGGATYCFFEPRMAGDAREQVELLRDLRRALAERRLELYYQPKVHAPSGQITGAEALVRWHHPKRGMISPGIFIPIAERFGLIGALGDWVIDEGCRQIGVWRADGLRMRISINLSVHQLRQGELNAHIAQALERHRIEPGQLTVELTESVAMDDAEGTIRTIEALNALGVSISIDDFGTGHSSLSYLRRLNVGELKIDRSFVLDLETSADARAVVDAVVRLAQALGLKVVAEGVETEAQSAILRSLGCDELQGYLFAKPMSALALGLWANNTDDGPRPMNFRPSLFTDDPGAGAGVRATTAA